MRIEILQTPVDTLSFSETVAAADAAMKQRKLVHQVSLNVAKLVNMRTDQVLREDVLASSIISADGMGIVLAAKMLGRKVPERVAGVDLMIALLKLCAREGFRPYFLGATEAVVKTAADVAMKEFPGLVMAGYHDGYFTEKEEEAVVNDIRASGADCLFIAMPTPRKERFMKRHRDDMGVSFIMGVGGSLDILSGKTKRAPDWVQRAGMEWAYRVLQEPRRMIWRYTRTNCIFFFLLFNEIFSSRGTRTTIARG